MDSGDITAAPKPFVFVLMPFDRKFDDIYQGGIKEAARSAGAYAERVDEQYYHEPVLERVINQISKADVLVADMTGRNPNVFYEVGYAHALGKHVLLLTQSADDIPFDLRHRPFTVYDGSVQKLRNELGPKIVWALQDAASKRQPQSTCPIELHINDQALNGPDGHVTELRFLSTRRPELCVLITNVTTHPLPGITHWYLLTRDQSHVLPLINGIAHGPMRRHVPPYEGQFECRYRLQELPLLPAFAMHAITIQVADNIRNARGEPLLIEIPIESSLWRFRCVVRGS